MIFSQIGTGRFQKRRLDSLEHPFETSEADWNAERVGIDNSVSVNLKIEFGRGKAGRVGLTL